MKTFAEHTTTTVDISHTSERIAIKRNDPTLDNVLHVLLTHLLHLIHAQGQQIII